MRTLSESERFRLVTLVADVLDSDDETLVATQLAVYVRRLINENA